MKRILFILITLIIASCGNTPQKSKCKVYKNRLISDIYEGMDRDCFNEKYPSLKPVIDISFPEFDKKFIIADVQYESDTLISITLESEVIDISLFDQTGSRYYQKEKWTPVQIQFFELLYKNPNGTSKSDLEELRKEFNISDLFNIENVDQIFKEKYTLRKVETLKTEIACNDLAYTYTEDIPFFNSNGEPVKYDFKKSSENAKIQDRDEQGFNISIGEDRFSTKYTSVDWNQAIFLLSIYSDNGSLKYNYNKYYFNDATKQVQIFPIIYGKFPFNIKKKVVLIYSGLRYPEYLRKEREKRSFEIKDSRLQEQQKKEEKRKQLLDNI